MRGIVGAAVYSHLAMINLIVVPRPQVIAILLSKRLIGFFVSVANDFRRRAAYDGQRRYVFRNDRPGAQNCPLADGHTWHDHDAVTDPNAITYHDISD